MDLLLMGLSGCTGIVMTIAMEDMEAGLESLEIRAEGTRSEDPGELRADEGNLRGQG